MWPFIFAISETTLFGAAAAFSSLIGIALAILSHIEGRKSAEAKAEQELHEELIAAQREAEQLSAELHKLRMEQQDE